MNTFFFKLRGKLLVLSTYELVETVKIVNIKLNEQIHKLQVKST